MYDVIIISKVGVTPKMPVFEPPFSISWIRHCNQLPTITVLLITTNPPPYVVMETILDML